MKKWNAPVVAELDVKNTESGFPIFCGEWLFGNNTNKGDDVVIEGDTSKGDDLTQNAEGTNQTS